jgi:hypothetical protein
MTHEERNRLQQALSEALVEVVKTELKEVKAQQVELFSLLRGISGKLDTHLGKDAAKEVECAQRHCILDDVRCRLWRIIGTVSVLSVTVTWLLNKLWEHVIR